ncbi:PREDICTED: protein N-lysine methyltransferase METTL20-like [Priapulus caudatus]|uniref:ETFB lysine methyltransferase n=1 Tax=Priapulus caudatus TaxID=37621 RepID=A0ABM1F2V5_PRICU|nr:PREDICTED: protein N-lysine methyltransferase METTL20-like [Priapulus caudatus]XP_014678776.1 PREDICTED: protein N-lysine methyltransferase METTL20-like [Priapulus caudatus]
MASLIRSARLLRRLHSLASHPVSPLTSAARTTAENVAKWIEENTEVSRDHLTPELRLRLVTQNCWLWRARAEDCPYPDPFWAFYWPGGQVLTRFLLDNPDVSRGKTVLDVGSGCGASAIAASMSGATYAIANDTDPIAATAVALNARLNGVCAATPPSPAPPGSCEICTASLVGRLDARWDVVLLGDMFYDDGDFGRAILDWADDLTTRGTAVLVGDPGRATFRERTATTTLRRRLLKVAEYDLPRRCREENSGFTTGAVWQFSRVV